MSEKENAGGRKPSFSFLKSSNNPFAAGGASRSYGIEAARLAGVPSSVVQRARQVLDQLAT